jgi:hypothetical protein
MVMGLLPLTISVRDAHNTGIVQQCKFFLLICVKNNHKDHPAITRY